MNWHDEPVTKPYCCNLCGNGAESKDIYGPFLVTDWLYEETAGAEYVDRLSTGNFRFTICAQCVRSICTLDGSPVVIADGAEVVQAVQETRADRESDMDRGELVRELIHALDERDAAKAQARMEKARAGKAAKREAS